MEVALFPISRSGEALVQPGAEVRAGPVPGRHPEKLTGSIEDGAFESLQRGSDRIHASPVICAFPQKLDEGYHANTRFQNFAYAVSLACMLNQDLQQSGRVTRRIHAHFAHDPALIAYLVHRLTGIRSSHSARKGFIPGAA